MNYKNEALDWVISIVRGKMQNMGTDEDEAFLAEIEKVLNSLKEQKI